MSAVVADAHGAIEPQEMDGIGFAQLWLDLRTQLTPFNSVIAIDGITYANLGEFNLNLLAGQFSRLIRGPVKYVRDCIADRVFLGPDQAFPPGSYITQATGGHVLLDPNSMMLSVNQAASMSGNDRSSPDGAASDAEGSAGASKTEKVSRPPNAFIIYRKDYHEIVKAANPGIHNTEISKIIGLQWQNETPEVKALYKDLADKVKQEHSEKHPDYQYQPRKSSDKKRRMTKKKAAALAAANGSVMEGSAQVNVKQTSEIAIAQQIFEEDPAEGAFVNNFLGLVGTWDSNRAGILPGGTDMLNAVEHHNSQPFTHPDGGIDHVQGFGATVDFFNLQNADMATVPWESFIEESLYDTYYPEMM